MALPAPIRTPSRVASIPVHGGNNRVSGYLDATVTPGAKSPGQQIVNETHQVVMTMPAGATQLISIPGISYYFGYINLAAGVSVRAINAGQPRTSIIHVQGTGLRFGTQTFNAIEITNTNGAAVTFTVYIGGGVPNNSYDEFIDKRVIVSSSTSVTIATAPGTNVTVQNGITFSVGYTTRDASWGDSLNAAASQVVTDGYVGKARKSIIFANDDNVSILTVLDVGGNIMGSIQPATSWTIDTGGTVTLHNPSGGAVVCHIGEVYYS